MAKRYDIENDELVEVTQEYFNEMQDKLIRLSKLLWDLKRISDDELIAIINSKKT